MSLKQDVCKDELAISEAGLEKFSLYFSLVCAILTGV